MGSAPTARQLLTAQPTMVMGAMPVNRFNRSGVLAAATASQPPATWKTAMGNTRPNATSRINDWMVSVRVTPHRPLNTVYKMVKAAPIQVPTTRLQMPSASKMVPRVRKEAAQEPTTVTRTQ